MAASATLILLGPSPHLGPIEQQCYQRPLTTDDKSRLIAAANATSDVSDDARQSWRTPVCVVERDAWFAPWLNHLMTFLKDQRPGTAALTAEQLPSPAETSEPHATLCSTG